MAGPTGRGSGVPRNLAVLAVAVLLLAAGCGQSGGAGGPRLSVILAEAPAKRLADYGLFVDPPARTPAAGVTAYDLVNPLFSDHAAKHRFVFVPGGKAATYNPDDVFDFPVGSVLVKTFAFAPDMREPEVDARYIETRLLIRKEEGWVAYPYVWNAEQTEAVYSPIGAKRAIETTAPDGRRLQIAYAVPNQNQCKTCHQQHDAMTPIGPSARNLNHVGPHGANQLSNWSERGILTGLPESGGPSVPSAGDPSQPLDARARAWLDINCAHCHSAGGSASNSGLFLRWDETNPTGWGIGKRPVAAGRGAGENLFVIEPGAPDKSILVHRTASVEPGVLMPELGRTTVDEAGLSLVREWIAAMPAAGETP